MNFVMYLHLLPHDYYLMNVLSSLVMIIPLLIVRYKTMKEFLSIVIAILLTCGVVFTDYPEK